MIISNEIFALKIPRYFSSYYLDNISSTSFSVNSTALAIFSIGIFSLCKFFITAFFSSTYDCYDKAKVIKTVKDVNQKIDEGGMLEQMIPFGNSTPMSQDDLKKLYLNKMGGTSLFSPVLAFCVLDLITSIISKL